MRCLDVFYRMVNANAIESEGISFLSIIFWWIHHCRNVMSSFFIIVEVRLLPALCWCRTGQLMTRPCQSSSSTTPIAALGSDANRYSGTPSRTMVGRKHDRILVAFESLKGKVSAIKEELAGVKEELKELKSNQDNILWAYHTFSMEGTIWFVSESKSIIFSKDICKFVICIALSRMP